MENYTLTYQLQQIHLEDLTFKPGKLYATQSIMFRAKDLEEARKYTSQKLMETQGIELGDQHLFDFSNADLDVQVAYAELKSEKGTTTIIVPRSSSLDTKVA